MEEERKKKAIEWVKKLMALANDKGAHDGESESAREKAEGLMDMYKITLADLIEEKDVKRFIGRIDVFGMGRNVKKWEVHLGYVISKAFNCKFVYRSSDSMRNADGSFEFGWSMSIVGTDKDMELVVWFHKYLRRTIAGLAKLEYSNRHSQESFCFGFAERIGARLQEMYNKQEQFIRQHGGENCMALMIVKKQEVEDEYHRLFPNTRKSRGQKISDYGAYQNGHSQGNRVGLNMPISRTGSTASQKQIG